MNSHTGSYGRNTDLANPSLQYTSGNSAPGPGPYPTNIGPMLLQSFTWPPMPAPAPAERSTATGTRAPSTQAASSRSSLTDGQRLQLVRLCCLKGEEYLGSKVDFWAKRTMEFNLATGKAVSSARTIVTRLYIKYRSDVADVILYLYSY